MNARDETAHYTELMPDGKARQYMFLQGVKSVIVKPSFGMSMKGPGFYEISGLAWSGAGRISKVEVSADGGKSWAVAALGAAGFAESADSLQARLAMGRESICSAEPGYRRERHGAADSIRVGGAVCARAALPLQRHSKLEHWGRWDGEKCLRVNPRLFWRSCSS